MTECAWCATRTKNTFFSARYGRLAARRGKKRALVAIAAEMLKVVYHMLKDGTAYREPGANYMDDRRRQNQIDYYKKRLLLYYSTTDIFYNHEVSEKVRDRCDLIKYYIKGNYV